MNRKLLSRAMRELARHRHKHEDPERLRQIVSDAGKASWAKLTPAERAACAAHMRAGRKSKAQR